ncbi:MAG TPA: ABC transporter ATP-binding protein [Thermomicrobiales bacterium]|nr:ABC transporter ATP-binding protein [Thermomicrobiales bacterium]
MDRQQPAINVESAYRRYRSGRRDIPALAGVSLTVEYGEWVAIVGPSGCGKSTLLNLLAGIDGADDGAVDVAGQRLNGMSENALAAWRGREVGIVFQFFQLMPTLTVLENVILPMDLAGNNRDRRERALQLLDQVGVLVLAGNLPSELSGGEQQRVAIARALANSPRLLLADEPTGNLDSRNGEIVVDLLEQLWRNGTTIVMVTHDPEVAARASRTITMRDGQIVDDCSSRAIPLVSFAANG